MQANIVYACNDTLNEFIQINTFSYLTAEAACNKGNCKGLNS